MSRCTSDVERRTVGEHVAFVRKVTTSDRGGWPSSKSFTPMCSCGWSGETRGRQDRQKAIGERDQHLADEEGK